MPKHDDFTADQLAGLSRLADGTLEPERRAGVEAMLAASPELQARYEREVSVVTMMAEARAHGRAPDALRARVAGAGQKPPSRAASRLAWRPALTGFRLAGAAALAVMIVAAILVLSSGTPAGPSVAQASALALLPARTPVSSTGPQGQLDVSLDGLYFPNWAHRFGWTATGQRVDRLDGRAARTVDYASEAGRVSYTIIRTPALRDAAGSTTRRGGYVLHTSRQAGRTVVSWERDGHTCVLSARTVPASVLLTLAAWNPPGVVT